MDNIYQESVAGFLKSIRWHAWVAVAAGLFAGWLCRGTMPPVPPLAPESGGTKRTAKTTAPHHGITPGNAPTTRYINELAGIPASRCEELFREICAPGQFPDPIRLECVFRRWIELEDAEQLLSRLSENREIQQQIWAGPFFEAWAAVDYAGAVAGTAKFGNFTQVRILVGLRTHDPSVFDKSFAFYIGDSDRRSALVKALSNLGRDTPDQAVNVATREGKPNSRADMINIFAEGWATRDPQAALDWVKSLDLNAANQLKALNLIFGEWLKLDPAAAAEAFKSSSLATEENKMGLDASLEVLRSPETLRSQISSGVHLDPFLDLAGLHRRISATPGDLNPKEFVVPPIDRDGWFCTDPARTAEEASHLPPGNARDIVMSYICNQWADRNPEEATAFAKLHGLPDPHFRDEPSTEMVSTALAAPQETLAALFAPAEKGSEIIPAKYLSKLAEKWSAADPQAAAEWLIAQPDASGNEAPSAEAREGMMNNFLGYHWARVDAVGASDWLENLPPGPRKNEACRAMSHYIGTYSPDLAFTVSASILEGEARAIYLESGIRRVADEIGPPAARELLGSVGLTPDEQASLGRILDSVKPAAR